MTRRDDMQAEVVSETDALLSPDPADDPFGDQQGT